MKHLLLFALSLALTLPASANVLGDMQTFAPSTDGQDFITVHSGRPLRSGFWAFSGYVNYAKNHLLVYSDMDEQTRMNYKDELMEFDLDVAYAWSDELQFFLAAPILMSQSSDSEMNPRISVTRGVHSWRPGFKWSFINEDNRYWAFIFSTDFMNVIDNPYTGNDTGPIVNAEVAGTWKNGSITKAINLGYRMRKAGTLPPNARMYPLDDQLIASAGLSGGWSKSARWVTEVIASTPLKKSPYKRQMDPSSLDVLLGMKHRWFRNLNFDWGLTFEPAVKTLSPDWRLFTGLVYYWGPKTTSTPSQEEDVPLQTQFADADNPFVSALDLTEDLRLLPEVVEIPEGSRQQFTADGGIPPYRYRVIQGGGRVDPNGLYRAPTRAGTAVLEVTDKEGMSAQARVKIVAPPKPDRLIRLGDMKFKFDSDQLIESSNKDLDRAVAALKKLKIRRVIVEGHTDWIGDNIYNQELSERRAETIRQILIKRVGLSPSVVQAVGYGMDRPIADNRTDLGRQRNRRVDLKVYLK